MNEADTRQQLLESPVEITEEQLERMLRDRPWFRLPDDLDALVAQHGDTSSRCTRADILTWAYKMEGLIGFTQVWQRLTGYSGDRATRKVAIRTLGMMLKQNLLTRMHFTADAPSKDPAGMNEGTAFEIAASGMIYLMGAWTARQKLARTVGVANAHEVLCEEEDGDRAHELHYVRTVVVVDAARKPIPKPKYVTSVFAFGR